ncbi:hypothetical protein ACOSP7_014959 [Xanthoceras sorbifolium]
MYLATVSSQLRGEPTATGALSPIDVREADFSIRCRRALKRVDRELSRGNIKTALSLVKQLQNKPRGLRGFGAAKQVSKMLCSLDELNLKLDANEMLSLQLLVDSVMESIESCTDFGSLDEDSIDRFEISMQDKGYGSLCEDDHFMCTQHEAGHFLVGYLLGVLPKGYMVPSIESLRQGKFTAARVEFVGFEFLKEVAIPRMLKKDTSQVGDRANRSKISSKTLNNFSCVLLGGLVAEHIVSGYSDGHHADINKLERVFRWLGYKKSEADYQLRWAALNTVLILHHHMKASSKLAEAMAMEKPISSCIDTIEKHLTHKTNPR